jgi:hypothetical protein
MAGEVEKLIEWLCDNYPNREKGPFEEEWREILAQFEDFSAETSWHLSHVLDLIDQLDGELYYLMEVLLFTLNSNNRVGGIKRSQRVVPTSVVPTSVVSTSEDK